MVFHIMGVSWLVAALGFFVTYRRMEDLGFLYMALACGMSGAVSLLTSWWWPLIVGAVVTCGFLLVVADAHGHDVRK